MSPPVRWARLVARGAAGVAVFRIAGDRARDLLAAWFSPRRAGALGAGDLRSGVLAFGDDQDDAVVRVGGNADSFRADVAVHGSDYVSAALEAALSRAGARDDDLASHAADALVAEAYQGLATAYAAFQVQFFLHAADGALSDAVGSIASSLAGSAPRLDAIGERVDALLARAAFGRAVATPPVVVIAGAPNAGKSTLFNALLGEDRALTSPEPGTTRDVVSERAVVRDRAFRLADSAGLRVSADTVERLGVARAEAAARSADIVLLVIDPLADLDAQLRLAPGDATRRVAVLSKFDLRDAEPALDRLRGTHARVLTVSARTGAGIDGVRDAIVAASAFGGSGDVLQSAPFLERHVDLLRSCRRELDRGSPPGALAALAELRHP